MTETAITAKTVTLVTLASLSCALWDKQQGELCQGILGATMKGTKAMRKLSAPDRAIEVAIAIATRITETLTARSGVLCRGCWLSTDWGSQVYQRLSMSEWNLLGDPLAIPKPRNLRSRSNGDRTPKNSSFCRSSCDESVCDWLQSLIAGDLRSRSVVH